MKDMNQKFKEYLRNEFIIERDGVKIALTPNELRDLRLLEKAREGFYSLDWYADYLSGLDEDDRLAADITDTEAMMQDFYQCVDVADEVYEALTYDWEGEKLAVERILDDYKQQKRMEARNE